MKILVIIKAYIGNKEIDADKFDGNIIEYKDII